jgi:hypothetical protein
MSLCFSMRATIGLPVLLLAAEGTHARLWESSEGNGIVPVVADCKLALVIGNSSHKYLPAIQPVEAHEDDVHATPTGLGVTITLRKVVRPIRGARAIARRGDIALDYCSGHRGQVGEENCRLRPDCQASSSDEELVSRGVDKMSDLRIGIESRAKVRVFVFDAWRSSGLLLEPDEGASVSIDRQPAFRTRRGPGDGRGERREYQNSTLLC